MSSFADELKSLRENQLYRSLKEIDSDQGVFVEFQGRQFLNFSSNNYLGLANDPRLKQAAIEATEKYGTGSGASRLITGSMYLHHQLEEKLARFKTTEAALVFNSGYQANLGILTALMREGDEIFSDELNHASIIDGCRLSRASTTIYRHKDLGQLEELLKGNSLPFVKGSQKGFLKDKIPLNPPFSKGEKKRRLIVTDSIFSMDGDAAPLKELAVLAEKYDCFLMVDEAHATGVFGKKGRGLVEATWPEGLPHFLKERLIQMGTLGKALGSFGAYVAAKQDLIELLINKARAFIYTTSLPPGVLAASLKALDIVEQEPERRSKLWENVAQFQSKFFHPSFIKGSQGGGASPIIPLLVGSSEKALQFSQQLFEKGFWVTPIRYPTVARGSERLRITLMATQSTEQIQSLIQALGELNG